MRLKSFQVLSLGLIPLTWLTITLSPGQAAASDQPQTDQPQTEDSIHLACTQIAVSVACHPDVQSIQTNDVPSDPPSSGPQFFTPNEQAAIANALIGLGYLLPVGLGLGIFLYDRYTHYRAALLKQQIQTLERIWEQGPEH